ncbi:addiction module family protein [Salegentibacter maritimus]|uniref:Addiction module family protein n=1 Tax=Salegentibacter maritimus TaxID=2794347 RepID=A0ABS0TBZ5_9FLAO|nr:addiction module family protein [Salegentibacter maritimus]MBI6118561.1 addiction module family protein [Salegentibacter maritimus]
MDTLEIKDRIRKYIERADDRMLMIINAIIEADEGELLPKPYREVLDKRLKYHQENPKEGKSWEEIQNALKKEYEL